MIYTDDMEHRKSKNPELAAILGTDTMIVKINGIVYIRTLLCITNILDGSFHDQHVGTKVNVGDSIIHKLREHRIKCAHTKHSLDLTTFVCSKMSEIKIFSRSENRMVNVIAPKGITLSRAFNAIDIVVNGWKRAASDKHMLFKCTNINNLAHDIEEASKFINIKNTDDRDMRRIEDYVYIRLSQHGVPLMCGSISVPDPVLKLKTKSITRSLKKFSFDEALEMVRNWKHDQFKKYNINPTETSLNVDVTDIKALREEYKQQRVSKLQATKDALK